MAKQSSEYTVTVVSEDATGRIVTRNAGTVRGWRAALAFARNQAGDGARFVDRGAGVYRQRGYAGASGVAVVED